MLADFSRAAERQSIVFVSNDIRSLIHHRRHLVDHALDAGVEPILLGDETAAARDAGYECLQISIKRFAFHLSDLTLFLLILRTLLREQPLVLHLISIKPYLYGGLAARLARFLGWRGKVVVTVPGLGRLYDHSANAWNLRIRLYIVEWWLRLALKKATVSFETSSDRDHWLARGTVAPHQTIVTRGAGIDFNKFHQPDLRHSDGTLRVLYAGRLLRSKGLEVFLKAAELNTDRNIHMIVAGFHEKHDPDAIAEDTLFENPNITFVGAISDMPALLGNIDVVVLPSRYNEGIPRILLESAACGCVSIATRFAGSMELIKDGETGYFLNSDDPNIQAKEISSILADLRHNGERRQTLGAKAAEYVRNNGFSAEDVTEAFFRMYQPINSYSEL